MHEILFRGKTLTGYWIEGYYLNRSNGEEEIHCIMERFPATVSKRVIPETVGQYTGLTDKNGTKIFEGDICKHRSNYSGDFVISIVTYTDGQFLSMADNNSGFNLSDKLEVIGNIHDKPELLEGDTSDA